MEIDEHLQNTLSVFLNPLLTIAYNSILHHEKENHKSLVEHQVLSHPPHN
jgi:hypothetical protein